MPLERFRAKAEASSATVLLAADEDAAADLVLAAAPATAATASLAARFPRVAARLASRPRLPDTAAEVAAAGRFAVAETGSIVLAEAAADRSACWLAERLWLLVPAGALEATLEGALARVAALVRDGAAHVTLMSGPSRTADIERTLTIGVHGPREVRVVLVGSAG